MRRLLAITVIPLLACLVIAGCGSSKPSASSSSSAAANANAAVTATGAFGTTPKVNIPKLKASNTLTVKTIVLGTGAALTSSDSLAANFEVYTWDGTSSVLKQNTFTSNPTMIPGNSLPGLETALIGKKIGSRVLAVIPPKEGFGTAGNPQAGISGTTTLVFVIDMIKAIPTTASASGAQESNGGGGLPTVNAHPGSDPKVTIPPNNPPSTLVTKTLIKGSGPKVVKGEYVIAQYTGYIWRTKQEFDSSWKAGSPYLFVFDSASQPLITGWNLGLAGQTVGSRVMLVIPPKDGYGSAGQSQAGITGKDTLVFVIDIIDAFMPTA
jgi:FKBP-type peptidyl-prolyl cis-trans isomerase